MTIPGNLISTLFAKAETTAAPAQPAADPYYSSVSLLLQGDGANGSTTFVDSSPSPKTVTSTGVTVSTTQSKFGGASMYFGSSNGKYLSLSSAVNFNSAFTIEGWIYPTSASPTAYSILFGKSGLGNPQFLMYYADGRVGYYNGGTVYTSAASKLSFNQWSHYAIVRQGSSVAVYINGVDIGLSITDSTTVTIDIIGGYGGGPTVYNVIGYMDDLRFTTGVARYTANFTPPTAAFGDSAPTAAPTAAPTSSPTPAPTFVPFTNAPVPYTPFPGLSLSYTLDDPNAYAASQFDSFGVTVAISGNYAIIGAHLEDDAAGTARVGGAGKVYVFDVRSGVLLRTINDVNAYGTSDSDYFGSAVSLSGNIAVIGAWGEAQPSAGNAGKAYIMDITTGALMFTLNDPNAYGTASTDHFGMAVEVDGTYAIIGAPGETDAGGIYSGKAYIYNVTTGALLWTLNNPNPYGTSANDSFGTAVSIFGNYAIVGAYAEDDASGAGAGKAYIYNVTTGALLFTLNNPNAYGTSAGAGFGISVAIFGNYAAVGAHSEGRVYIYNVTTGALLFTLNNPNAYDTSTGDLFGYSVAIYNNYVVVGAYGEDGISGVNEGKAYIFDVTTGQQLHTITNPNAYGMPTNDQFGNAVAIYGNYIIVTASNESDDGGQRAGKAYIYTLETSTSFSDATLTYTLNNPNPYGTSATDYFGAKVAVSGNYTVIGATSEDDTSGTDSGKAYIYNTTTGALLFTLSNPNAYGTSAGDNFGNVAVSGNYAIVSAPSEDDGAFGSSSGKAYIYNITTGALLFTLNNPNAYGTSSGDSFGNSVAIDGNYAIVGARSEDDAAGTTSGKAYIFNVTTGALLFTLNNPNPYGTSLDDFFGHSVAISGNYVIVGAYLEDDAGGTNSGKAYIYNTTTGALLFTLNNPNGYNTSAYDLFGHSVAISGNYAIVGAHGEDDIGGLGSGKAYIYNVTTGALLRKISNPNAYSTSVDDQFGYSVDISGNYAIVGAYSEDDIGGLVSGKAYIFEVTTGALVKTIDNPNAYGTSASDYFGVSVAISGNYAVVSAYNESDAGGSGSGKAYIYTLS